MTPAQERTLALLRRPFELPDLSNAALAIRADTTDKLRQLADRWQPLSDGRTLRITKRDLAGCERRRVEDTEQFRWDPAKAEGTMLGQLIQLWLFNPGTPAEHLWDRAVTMASNDSGSFAEWICAGCSPGDWAELRLRCLSALVQFAEVFPPLGADSKPAVETTQQFSVIRPDDLGGRARPLLTVTGKVDIQLGADQDQRSGVVFVELKKARVDDETMDELRLYALLRTLRVGTPPRLLAAMSIATGQLITEDVTPAMLDRQAERLIFGIQQAITLAEGRTPTTAPSGLCRWCNVLDRCTAGQTHLNERSP